MRGGFWVLAAALASLAGCGYVGDIHPPALGVPMAVTDLNAMQRGDKLKLAFTRPQMTLDQIPITSPGEIDLRIGPPPEGDFKTDVWANSATRVPTSEQEVFTPIRAFAGKEVFAAVRTAGPKGRWSTWSNVVTLRIVEPLATPANLKAAADAGGIRLEWQHQGPQGALYRVFRKAEADERFTVIAPKAPNPYLDATAEYDKPYRYQVQAAIEADGKEAESELSETVDVTAADTFAPAVPADLNGIVGVGSVELAWGRNTETDLRGYHVYRAEGEAEFQRIGDLTEAPVFSDRMVQAGKTYRYAVTSVDQRGNESARSQTVSITIPQ